jgi:hypothetical protein
MDHAIVAFAILIGSVLSAQEYDSKAPLPPELVTLSRIRRSMSENLKRQPDYTCSITIERSHRTGSSKRFQLEDTVRLEVAYSGGKELYSWPGSSKFDERDVTEIVKGGAIGTGDFAGHASNVYSSNHPRFDYIGRESIGDRTAEKFHFVVSRAFSRYEMRIGGARGIVGYQGYIWHDAQSLDAIRLELSVDDIPPDIPLSGSRSVIDYARMRIGDGEFLLPQASEITLTRPDGSEARNRTTFSGCRQYKGESTLTFDEPPPPQAPQRRAAAVMLPGSLMVELRIEKPLDMRKIAMGDLLETRVTEDVKQGRTVWLSKGAKVQLRIARIEFDSKPVEAYSVVLEPVSFQSGDSTGEFRAKLTPSMAPEAMQSPWRDTSNRTQVAVCNHHELNVLVVSGLPPIVPSGFSMTWRTLESAGAKP